MQYYYTTNNGEQFGPLSLEELLRHNISKDFLVWREDWSDWKLAENVDELIDFFDVSNEPEKQKTIKKKASKTKTNKDHKSKFSDKNETIEKVVENINVGITDELNPSSIAKSLKVNFNSSSPMFKKVFSLKGRIRRLEYGITLVVGYFILAIISIYLAKNTLLMIPYNIILWIIVSQGTKRCHDMGNSGWYQLIPFYFVAMIFIDGKPGPNEYGENPKGIN